MTKQSKPDNPHRIHVAFERRHAATPARATVLVMQRFAARVCAEFPQAVVKGGLGLELRLDTPRTTKDADIIIAGSHDLAERLIQAGMLDLGDFMRFKVSSDKGDAPFTVPGMPYPANRFTIRSFFIDGEPLPSDRPYRKFTLEVSIREPAGYEEFVSTWDGFPQIRPAVIRVYSLSWQIAEKVHAYTDPRYRDSNNPDMWRPRDLLDMCRCASAQTPAARVESQALRTALEVTFAKRKAAAKDLNLHDLPIHLPRMPPAWESEFLKQVTQASLPWLTSNTAHAVASKFIDPVLDGTATGVWQPTSTSWQPERR
jgi:hypothetical protein